MGSILASIPLHFRDASYKPFCETAERLTSVCAYTSAECNPNQIGDSMEMPYTLPPTATTYIIEDNGQLSVS
jgi:hypothetical protein